MTATKKAKLALAAERARSLYLPQPKVQINNSAFARAIVPLFSNETFWMNMKIKTLGMLLTTSKEIRNEILLLSEHQNASKKKSVQQERDAKITQSLLHVLNLILKNHSVVSQEISVVEAVRRFALSLPIINTFFTNQPSESMYHHFTARKYQSILFISAFKLAIERKGGLHTIVKIKDRWIAIRNRTTERMVNTASQVLESVNAKQLQMMDGTNQAILMLKNEGNREKFMGRITILRSVRDNIVRTQTMADWLHYVLETPQLNKDRGVIRKAVKNLAHHQCVLIRRYNSHHRLGQYEKIVVS